MDTHENWRDIPGYEGLYQASDQGRIRTHPNKITSNARNEVRRWKTRVMKGRGDNCGTGKRVGLWKDGEVKDYLFARIIGMVWVQGYSPNLTINHINGNRLDNRAENLEWVPLAENIRHGFRTGLYDKCRKPVGLKSKTTAEVTRFNSMAEASRYLGKNNQFISLRLSRERPDLGEFEVIKLQRIQ